MPASELKQDMPPETPDAEIAAAIQRVSSKKAAWASLSADSKLQYLRGMLEALKAEYQDWARTSAAGHGYDFDNPEHGHMVAELFLIGPGMTGNWFQGAIRTYEAIVQTGKPPQMTQIQKRPDGSSAVKLFPFGPMATVFAGGMTLEAIIPAGKEVTQFNPVTLPAGVAGILGAGNFDAPIDVLNALFFENQVAVFKANPVNYHTLPHVKRIFAALEADGYVAFLYGGPKQGAAIVNSPSVDNLCMTGSCRTYDKIVWGSSEKKGGKPLVTKPFKAELGSVNPYIICPGNWSDSEIDAHAQALVAARMLNDGHVCAAPQVVITSKKWAQREQFLNKVREWFRKHPGTRPFYPACDASWKRQLEELEAAGYQVNDIVMENPAVFAEQLKPIFATGVAPGSHVTREEAFCPVLSEVALDVPADANAFLPAAVKFANDGTWGSLTGTLIVDSATQKSASAAVEAALDQMKFGCVGLNCLGGFAILYPETSWGAYPGHTIQDIQSGIGKLGNCMCLKDVSKIVMRYPFIFPAISKVPVNKKWSLLLMRRFTEYMIHQNYWRLTKMLSAAVAGL